MKLSFIKIFQKFLFIIVLFIFVFPTTISAQNEEVREFTSQITIKKDATIDVKEKIIYYFPEDRHGIFRTIPFRYKDETINRYFKF